MSTCAFMLSVFQSTHPVRGATTKPIIYTYQYVISIHAPREGCDSSKEDNM